MPWTAWLAILGPGLISANAGNDAGAIATYSSVGAAYGYRLIWAMVLITFGLISVQEMCARMGAVTGKGLTELIRENFSLRWTAFAILIILITGAFTTVSEFAGIAAGLELLHVSRYVSVPASAAVIWFVVMKGSYGKVERIFLAFTVIFFSYIFSAFVGHPNWAEAARSAVVPTMEWNLKYITLFIAIVGTTITPYMQVVLQTSIVERGVNIREYAFARWDTIFGAIFANSIAIFIIICAAATLHKHGHTDVQSATDAALALEPLAGHWAFLLFTIGMFGASMLAAHVLPLSTAFSISEAIGWESRISDEWHEAKQFYRLFTGLVLFGALFALIPGLPLFRLLILVQALNGVLLPIFLAFILLLVNDREIMGEHVNSRVGNCVAWVTAGSVSLLSLVYLVMTVTGIGG